MTIEGKNSDPSYADPELSYLRRVLAAGLGVLAVIFTGDPEGFDRKSKS